MFASIDNCSQFSWPKLRNYKNDFGSTTLPSLTLAFPKDSELHDVWNLQNGFSYQLITTHTLWLWMLLKSSTIHAQWPQSCWAPVSCLTKKITCSSIWKIKEKSSTSWCNYPSLLSKVHKYAPLHPWLSPNPNFFYPNVKLGIHHCTVIKNQTCLSVHIKASIYITEPFKLPQ